MLCNADKSGQRLRGATETNANYATASIDALLLARVYTRRRVECARKQQRARVHAWDKGSRSPRSPSRARRSDLMPTRVALLTT